MESAGPDAPLAVEAFATAGLLSQNSLLQWMPMNKPIQALRERPLRPSHAAAARRSLGPAEHLYEAH